MTPAPIPVARPRLPTAEQITPYLREIDANGWYANFGPLTRRLQARLASHWGLSKPEVTLVASGTVAITLALLAANARPGFRCLMPSWTFAASAGAVRAAGLVPHFLDVDPTSWALDPLATQSLASEPGVGAILVIAPFGAPLDLAAWDDVQQATGLPVVIDAAAAFDTLRDGGPMRTGRAPVIVSLHATKVFGLGEGGAVLSRDTDLLERIRRLSNFGFLGSRDALLPGLNGKLSEHAAAVGLAALDTWRATRLRWSRVTQTYTTELDRLGIATVPGFGQGWVSATLPILWPLVEPRLAEMLLQSGVSTLRWWGAGCHAQPAYRDCPREGLPVTERLAQACTGLPFWQDMTSAQIDHVCRSVARLAVREPALAGLA